MTPAEFRAAQPAFAASPPDDPTIQRWIDRANADGSDCAGLDADTQTWWIAHFLVVEAATGNTLKTAGTSSLATMKKVGTEAIGFSDKVLEMIAKEPFTETRFGRRFLVLRQTLAAGPLVF